MGFYYAREKKKFDAEWEKTDAWYKSEGMSDEDIEKMRLFDWAQFCCQRSYENRTQPLPEEYFDDENGSTLFQKFEQLTVTVDSETFQSRYDWIEQISDARLARKLKSLSANEIEMQMTSNELKHEAKKQEWSMAIQECRGSGLSVSE